ncbi:MAG: hemerythrin domain-containing protein [Lautropia sp.]
MDPQLETRAGAPTDAPIAQFSRCHEGILSHLDDFGRLPALLEPAAQARRIATSVLAFFRSAVFEHHLEEEKELFPAVLASARPGAERDRVQAIVDRLTREHREVEAQWTRLEPALKKVAKGAEAAIDGKAIEMLVRIYHGHAAYEEKEFLPMSQEILGRDGNHMAALGLSLHLRHSVPEVLKRYSSFV